MGLPCVLRAAGLTTSFAPTTRATSVEGRAQGLAVRGARKVPGDATRPPRPDQGKVVQHNPGGGDREAGEGIEERNPPRNIAPADREDKGHAQHQGQYEQWHEEDRLR